MKIKEFRCYLFGHSIDENCMMQNNVQYCLRCFDQRAFYYDGTNYWTDKEYYGLIGYPIWKIKNYILAAWIFIKLKTGRLKINNKDDYDPDLPF